MELGAFSVSLAVKDIEVSKLIQGVIAHPISTRPLHPVSYPCLH